MALLVLHIVSANAQILFERVVGSQLSGEGWEAFEDSSGNYMAMGYAQNPLTLDFDFHYVKFDSVGNVLWERFVGGPAIEQGWGAAVDGDRYLLVGVTSSFGLGARDYYLVKTAPDGSVIWEKTYGGTADDAGRDVVVTADGGYAMIGSSASAGTAGNYDGWLVKTDSAGVQLWDMFYGGTGIEYPYRLTLASDDGFILPMQSTSFGNGFEWYTVRTDSDGNVLWDRVYGTAGTDYAYEAAEGADSGVVVVGTIVTAIDDAQLTVVKYDKDGNFLWAKHPSPNPGDRPLGIKATSDGGFVITGYTSNFDRGEQMLLLKIDADGDLQWTRDFGGAGNEVAQHIALTSDGGYLLTGLTDGFNTPNMDLYVVKTDSLGQPPCPPVVTVVTDLSETCEGETVLFKNVTITSSTPEWIVDGVSQANTWNYVHHFAISGSYLVELVICGDTAAIPMTVHPLPDPGFSFTRAGSTFTFELDDAAQVSSIVWYFGDGEMSTALSPVHTYAQDGQYNVTVVVSDTNGCQGFASQYVSVVGLVALAEAAVSVSPNPFTDELIIRVPASSSSTLVTLVDHLGRTVMSRIVTENITQLDVASLPGGLYNVLLHTTSRGLYPVKVIKI